VLVLKNNVHTPGHFQYTIHYKGKSFSCQRTQKWFTSDYMHLSCFKYVVKFVLVSAILHHISLLRLLPKSYFKIKTFQPNYLCSSSFKHIPLCLLNGCVNSLTFKPEQKIKQMSISSLPIIRGSRELLLKTQQWLTELFYI